MIPVFEPYLGDEEGEAVLAAIQRGEISGSFGSAITDFEQRFAEYVGAGYGVACNSGTSALHLAAAAARLAPGDEVLVSACTNIATALACVHQGALVVPVDSERETWNLDLDLLEGLVTDRTRAVMPVHIYGHPVDMDRLNEFAARHDLLVIEDCAESHGATVRGRMTGSLGDMGCFSFYANKIITTGEGGMVTTSDEQLAERLRLLRNLAFTKPRFRHEEAGFNFRMAGYQAAMGLAQLDRIEWVLEQKRRVAQAYNHLLADVGWVQTPAEKEWARNVYWMYSVVLTPDAPVSRDVLTERLHEEEVDSRTFFCPMNLQPVLRQQQGHRPIDCPVAEGLWERGLYLPSSLELDEATISMVVDRLVRAAG